MRRSALGVMATVAAVIASVVSSMYVFGAEGYQPGGAATELTLWPGVGFAGAIAAAVMLPWRHKHPVLVTALAVWPPLVFPTDSMAALIAFAALAAQQRGLYVWCGGLAVYVATALAVWRDVMRHPDVTLAGRLFDEDPVAGHIIGSLVLAGVYISVPLVVGILRRTRNDLALRERHERELRAEMARREERSRIAHEMHDVLGHRLSLLSLQAGALEVSQTGSPKAGEVARTVRTTARQSLEDLRQVIGVLRDGRELLSTDGAEPAPPQPTLADVPELVAETRGAGVPVNLTMLLDPTVPVPAPLGIAVYRIVQESLTNVIRHAPGTPADVTVRGGPGFGVAVEVVNLLPDTAPEPSPGSGSGLAGIAERAGVLGGNVSAGPTPTRTFVVRAWLPWVAS